MLSHFSREPTLACQDLSPWGPAGKNTERIHYFSRDFPSPGLNLHLMSSALASGFSTTSAIWEAHMSPMYNVVMHLQRLYSTYSYYKLLAIFCVVQCIFVAYFIHKNLYLLLVYPISCFWLPLQSHFLLLSS